MTRRFAAVALVLGAVVAIPVAMVHADDEPAEATKSADSTSAEPKQDGEAQLPKHEAAQSLFRKWQASARASGKIPGGALRSLADAASNFVKFNPTDKRPPKLAELLKRMDMSHDWTETDAVSLLDDVTAVYANLPSWAMDQPRFGTAENVRAGEPLPVDLKTAPWGETQLNGLRVAWLLDPRAKQHRLNTPLKSRILFHNGGESTVVFRVLTWNQSGIHKAHDVKGADIRISSTSWTTIPQVVVCRLASDEFTEVVGAGIGVGANNDQEDWRGTRVGSWILAKAGDDVTFTPALVTVTGNFTNERAPGDPGWWLEFITNRLNRDAPLPVDAAERRRLLDRAVSDLFGTPPTPVETATFVADRDPDAMSALAKRLAQRDGTTPFTGKLQSGETTFRVLAVDPDAAKKPRVATGPGRYTLGDQVRLVIVGKSDGRRRISESNIRFYSSNPKTEPPGKPYEIKLPAGYLTWAIAWERGATVLWATQKGLVRKIDFSNPAQVKETRLTEPYRDKMPQPVFDALNESLH